MPVAQSYKRRHTQRRVLEPEGAQASRPAEHIRTVLLRRLLQDLDEPIELGSVVEPDQCDTSAADELAAVGSIRHASDKSGEPVPSAATGAQAGAYAEPDVVGSERPREPQQSGDVIDDRLQTADTAEPLAPEQCRSATITTPLDKRERPDDARC